MDLPATLRSLPHFASLSPTRIDALATALMVQNHPAGHVLIKEGKHGDTAYLLLEGEVAVTRQHEGRESELRRLGPGDLFGLLSMIDQAPRSASCVAVSPVRVASLPQSAFTLLFNAHADIAYALQWALAAQLAGDFRRVSHRIREALGHR
ncbi:MAG: cyclic nucleotide-binding domain-containing protein [Myxococcales bacterium]|nr:cyclic nucleotide-binding domain-containing protein [Myxococcales bacterium]